MFADNATRNLTKNAEVSQMYYIQAWSAELLKLEYFKVLKKSTRNPFLKNFSLISGIPKNIQKLLMFFLV